ncbi:E3 ubiquitin-protein ligase UPL7 [Quillaja saponaria]|uniref:HECT-type E3 ubiquitin transferase n=1 Tax=Quillaja saponaria TaxID=32244 RepID=A0AAD7PYD1_QUISA|nr:E3 ubiquitin-protein ligase UPL7 [Quillaja saponaria]KAJ7971466.1 E3 ubiquitin-protein ligase UPL7 [Quillaja saponaria]
MPWKQTCILVVDKKGNEILGLCFDNHLTSMDEHRKHQVSLRGASAKEITRDALLEKVFQERELRNYARRATAAALFIQRVWRRYKVSEIVAMQHQEEWEILVNHFAGVRTATWISKIILRPFLFFIMCLSTRHQKVHTRHIDCMRTCFSILLESMNSVDLDSNFCSLAIGTPEERRIWTYQAQKLTFLGFFILSQFSKHNSGDQDIVYVTSLAMRLVVVLTDLKGWKCITDDNRSDADIAVKDLIKFMGSGKCGIYISIGRYVSTLNNSSLQRKSIILTDVNYAAKQYCVFLLTIPWLAQRLPAVLLPALKHKTVLSSCFQTLLILKKNILRDMDRSEIPLSSKGIPPVGWALANVICLATGTDNDSTDSGSFSQGLEYALYVHVVVTLTESLLDYLDNYGCIKKEKKDIAPSPDPTDTVLCDVDATAGFLKSSYIDLLRPVCQQWHLKILLAIANTDSTHSAETPLLNSPEYSWKLELSDVAFFYSNMLRIFSILNPTLGSLPVLNMLSFTPGFLVSLWAVLENSLFPGDSNISDDHFISKLSFSNKSVVQEKRQKQVEKDGVNKWVSVLQKFTGKSQAAGKYADQIDSHPGPSKVNEDSSDVWDIEHMRSGLQGISKDMFCLLHLFCATYSHLLLVLDDIEFYEKQVPFTLEQQRRIASLLNTLVYNGLSHGSSQQSRPLMDYTIRCLHLMYERDCRHQFCPPDLWLSPARKSRPPIAVAARSHGVLSTNPRGDDASFVPSMGSIITTTPHVFPFEERVEMFREFVKMDKASRKMAGEVSEPGSRSIEIVVRRGHIVEDGYQQLNYLGSKLKSSIHVSFVSECGLPEAGLDYGGLSKEFLTDISKEAFAPEYGLFSQTSTSERLLIPNISARYLENGMQMIEFLGRVVGKALYEGILLDYSFSHVFVQKLLGRYSFLDELSTLDPELYRNLMYVKHFDGDVKDLSLDFTVTEESLGKRHVIELKSGGKDISVSNENKMQYIHAIADYKLNHQILPFSNAFYRGLTDLISPSWLKLFNASEFNQLLSGGTYDIDVDDLKNNTRYTGGYSEGSRSIKLFWEVIRDFEPKERCMLLKFVTSCSRAPLLGFNHLQPTFTIHKVACDVPLWATIGGQDVERLPSASTCYNTLKLPTYKRPSTLRAKLLYAISSNAGFELS